MQDTLRSPVLGSLPFYDQRKVVALLDQLPAMAHEDRVGWDPVLMSVLSACVIQERFGLHSRAAGNDISLHSGSAPTLDDVVSNVTHRSAGTEGVDTLSNPSDRQALVQSLESIDETTPTFP